MHDRTPLMMPSGQAAAYLGLTRYRLLAETKAGRIRSKRVGREYWFARVALENYAAGAERDAPESDRIRDIR